MLRPGVQVVRRGRDRLQIGLAAASCVVRRTPAHLAALADLQVGNPVNAPDLLRTLAQHDLLPPPRTTPLRLRIVGELGLPLGPLLDQARLQLSRTHPTHVLWLSRGEPDRSSLTELLREGLPHLVVRAVDDTVTVGPYVVPGQTACLSCVDLHRSDDDPEFADVIPRYVRRSAGTTPDPLLATLAMSWALTDLSGLARGAQPSSWSTTITFTPDLRQARSLSWLRHPECGCAW